MHVCVLLNVLDPYKGGSHLPLFAECKDTQFTIVCNRSQCNEADLPENVSVVTVPARIGPYYYGFADFLFARSVLKAHPPRSEFWKKFSVIHINQPMGPALRKLKTTGEPLLFLIHHPVTADLEVSLLRNMLRSMLRNMKWRLRYALLVYFQRKMCHACDCIATVSSTMLERISSDYGVSKEQIFVVPNGVDGDAFTFGSDADCQYDVVALGSFMHPRKGFPYLLTVYRALAASGKTIADVGRRSDEQMKELRSISGVTVHGMVDVYTLRDLVRHSRTLISTSRFEGFGLSLIEALACGHPAFAFSVGAVPEVLGGIDSSLVVDEGDTDALKAHVEKHLSLSPEQRDQKGQEYRNAVLERYSLQKSADALQAVYSEIAA